MDFQNFDLEYFQSQYERTVDYNLADSSVQCLELGELLGQEDIELLRKLPLYYPEVNGARLLRAGIAALYPNASAENVLVTVGASQANALVCSTLLQPGDEVIVISPGYRQVWGLALNAGCAVKELPLDPENDWRADLDRLESLISHKTKLVSVVNPNNPSGSILSRVEMERVVNICDKIRCWLHADEVYRGTEFSGEETPSFWGQYDRVICVNSFSKAYGLAGLRIGWTLAAPEVIEALWRRHEYAVIAAAGPSMMLAELALRSEKRAALLERQRGLSRAGHGLLQDWVREQDGLFSWKLPPSTSIAFVKYNLDVPSVELADHIRRRASVLVAPGAYLGTENHLRIAVGYGAEKLQPALQRITNAVAELKAETSVRR